MSEDVPLASGNAQQLQQVFLNLLSNARYALNQRFPEDNFNKRIEVEIQLEDSETGSEISVRLYNHGAGIPAERLPKVLLPFITSKPSSEGTGLGLSISNDIVKKHGGSLNISSREGLDTEVIVRFPVAGGVS